MDGGAQDFLTERFTNCTLQNLSSPPVRSTLNKQPEAPYKPLFSDILRHSHPATMFWSLEIGLAMYTCPLISHSTHSRASSLPSDCPRPIHEALLWDPFSYAWPATIGQEMGYALDRSPILLLAWLLCIVHPGSRYSLDNKCSHTHHSCDVKK